MIHALSIVFLSIIVVVAFFLVHDFYVSRNGKLRKIMINFFILQIIFWGAILYYILRWDDSPVFKSYFFVGFIFLKAALKFRLLYWLKFKK